MRASSVQMLTRTYCWQRRRYLLERTCLHLFAPLDSRLLLAASVKMKILFPFFKKNYLMRTFVFFTRGTGYGIRMHNLSTCVWESRMAQDKKNQKKQQPEMCLSCTTVSQMQCRQLKLHCLFLVTKMVSVWETELINLLIGLANFTRCGFHLLSLARWSSLWMPYL